MDDNFKPNFELIKSLSTHADVYIKAANDPTYKNTTQDFRIGNAGSLANYLLNMDKRPDPNFNRDVIDAKIIAYNNNGTDVKIRYADIYPQKGSLRLKVEYKVQFIIKETESITNTPIHE